MLINGQRRSNTRLAHNLERNTIYQSPLFVLVLFIQGISSFKQLWSKMNNFHIA